MATPDRKARVSSTSLIEPPWEWRRGRTRRGDRESVWIRPARRHAPKRAGGGARVLLGRLGHVGVGP